MVTEGHEIKNESEECQKGRERLHSLASLSIWVTLLASLYEYSSGMFHRAATGTVQQTLGQPHRHDHLLPTPFPSRNFSPGQQLKEDGSARNMSQANTEPFVCLCRLMRGMAIINVLFCPFCLLLRRAPVDTEEGVIQFIYNFYQANFRSC